MSSERPSREQLHAFLLGKVPAEQQEQIAAYLDDHPEVRAELEVLDRQGDDLIAELRGDDPSDTFTRQPQSGGASRGPSCFRSIPFLRVGRNAIRSWAVASVPTALCGG